MTVFDLHPFHLIETKAKAVFTFPETKTVSSRSFTNIKSFLCWAWIVPIYIYIYICIYIAIFFTDIFCVVLSRNDIIKFKLNACNRWIIWCFILHFRWFFFWCAQSCWRTSAWQHRVPQQLQPKQQWLLQHWYQHDVRRISLWRHWHVPGRFWWSPTVRK